MAEDPVVTKVFDRIEELATQLTEEGVEPALIATSFETWGLSSAVKIEGAERWAQYVYITFMQLVALSEQEKADGRASRH